MAKILGMDQGSPFKSHGHGHILLRRCFICKMAIEIVDLPSYKMVIFPEFFCMFTRPGNFMRFWAVIFCTPFPWTVSGAGGVSRGEGTRDPHDYWWLLISICRRTKSSKPTVARVMHRIRSRQHGKQTHHLMILVLQVPPQLWTSKPAPAVQVSEVELEPAMWKKHVKRSVAGCWRSSSHLKSSQVHKSSRFSSLRSGLLRQCRAGIN